VDLDMDLDLDADLGAALDEDSVLDSDEVPDAGQVFFQEVDLLDREGAVLVPGADLRQHFLDRGR